jgi:hypothetical protein
MRQEAYQNLDWLDLRMCKPQHLTSLQGIHTLKWSEISEKTSALRS